MQITPALLHGLQVSRCRNRVAALMNDGASSSLRMMLDLPSSVST